jgi:methylthioribose-1-phosphate isomerase
MRIHGQAYRSIWADALQPDQIYIFDQRRLPFAIDIVKLEHPHDFVQAIREMYVRGAPLIGATAAYGACALLRETRTAAALEEGLAALRGSRPTAIDLFHAIDRVLAAASGQPTQTARLAAARAEADALVEESVAQCRAIGQCGLSVIQSIAAQKPAGQPVHILTHCNAGWLACIEYGTATAPIYLAQQAGIPLHVWVDETRPRNQGAGLTAFELGQEGVDHTLIADNTGGHLMQHGQVDMVIVGTDRTTAKGDVANKIGTYLKALAAKDNGVPFYVAVPATSIDWNLRDGLAEIPIETRSADELHYVQGLLDDEIKHVRISPWSSPGLNYGFDVTPARLITGLITDRGICDASEQGLAALFPDKK